nr:uncharacterized protein LOC128692855 [Cherax quadricarinatus]
MSPMLVEGSLTPPFMLSFIRNASEVETNITVSEKSNESNSCILIAKYNPANFQFYSKCSNDTSEVIRAKSETIFWSEIFITAFSEDKLWIALCHQTCQATTVSSMMRPPFSVKMSSNSTVVNFVLNCPNAGCQMRRKGLVAKGNSGITSFFVTGGDNFTGIKISTKPSIDITLNSSFFMKSQWNQVYVICTSLNIYVLVNGSVVINKTTADKVEVSFVSFEVQGDGEAKWCNSVAPSLSSPSWYQDYGAVTYTGWVSVALLFLLCLVLICCIACRHRKSYVTIESCANPPTLPRCKAPTPERISITTYGMPLDEICLASEHIYDSWMDLEDAQQSSRHDSESGSSCASKAVKETSFMNGSESDDVCSCASKAVKETSFKDGRESDCVSSCASKTVKETSFKDGSKSDGVD